MIKTIFIILLSYHADTAAFDKNREGHIAFLQKYYEQDKFIVSGAKVPRTGAVIMAYNVTIEELNEILKEDPYYQNKLATYEVIELDPKFHHPQFEPFIVD